MNIVLPFFKSKLDAMRAAAPRATLHLLHESNGFSAYLGEAAAVQKISQLGTFTDHAEDVLMDDPVLHLFVPLECMVKFVEEVTAHRSVALMDVILATKVNAAKYVMYGWFPRCSRSGVVLTRNLPPAELSYPKPNAEECDCMAARCHRMTQAEIDEEGHKARPVPEFLAPVVTLPEKLAEKEADADFWG